MCNLKATEAEKVFDKYRSDTPFKDIEKKEAEGFATSLQLFIRGNWSSAAAVKQWLDDYPQMVEAFEQHNWFKIVVNKIAKALKSELSSQIVMLCISHL